MVKSMIADLARLEMKMQMTKLYDASGGLGKLLGSVLPAVFGGSSYSGIGIDPTTITGADITAAYSRISQAKGGAFDSGLLKFAKGGAFTNQIVNTPTQFKFAQGAGIMGEAGPEAIMPLQRDNRGNLGVRAQGGGTKVDVVVNNYSSEKAEAKEVVDSRGNRRIEVTVGEMVAAEVSRSNSPVNQSIKNSFGTKPALIRR
jgi:lambda family phage tail tape measure protein